MMLPTLSETPKLKYLYVIQKHSHLTIYLHTLYGNKNSLSLSEMFQFLEPLDS